MSNNDKKEIMFKEIDLIQSCITRMAQNSFIVKGWLITLLTVVLTLKPEIVDINILCLICAVSTFCFWALDAFFLKTEKMYRMKYEWVIKNRINSDDYMFDLNPYNSEMWINKNDKKESFKEPSLIRVMGSKTLLPMYMLLLVIVAFVYIVNLVNL